MQTKLRCTLCTHLVLGPLNERFPLKELALKLLRQHAGAVQPALILSDPPVKRLIAWKRAWARQLTGLDAVSREPPAGRLKHCTQSTLWHRSATNTSSLPSSRIAVKRKRRDSFGMWHMPRIGHEAGCCNTPSSCLTTHISHGATPDRPKPALT